MPFNLANKFYGTKSDNKNWQQDSGAKLHKKMRHNDFAGHIVTKQIYNPKIVGTSVKTFCLFTICYYWP